jgi:hypothetical protein
LREHRAFPVSSSKMPLVLAQDFAADLPYCEAIFFDDAAGTSVCENAKLQSPRRCGSCMGNKPRSLQNAVQPVAEPLDRLSQSILNLSHNLTMDVFPRDLFTIKSERSR